MATRIITDRDEYTITIRADAGGPIGGELVIATDDGRQERPVTVGPATANPDVVFSTLGTAGERAGFLAIIAAFRAAARTRRGYA